jgi:hypothetical protein
MKRTIVFALGMAAVLTGCREKGRPDPNIRMAVSHDLTNTEEAGGQGQGQGGGVPTRLEVPPEVREAYSGVRLRWKDATSGKEGVVDVPIGEGVPLPDPSVVVRADVFLPAFSMGGGVLTSDGVEAQNPAARITVFEGGKEIFGGWIFTRFPDVHPFTHSRFQLLLEGGVPRKGAAKAPDKGGPK